MKRSITRRNFIKKTGLVIGTSGVVPGFSFNITKKRLLDESIIGHGEFRYRVDKGWGIQDPSKIPVKDCHEMVQDKKGRILLLNNDIQNNLIIYDKSGKVLKTWGNNFPGAHGLTLVEEGDEEYLFITDHVRHQIFKTTLDGEILLELDYPEETGVYESAEKYNPTEIAVAPNGDFYVADGYGENYIIQYSYKGEYIRHFGGKGDLPEQFDCCHGVTIDTRGPGNPTLLITSRTKNEFKRFTLSGEHIETIPMPGCWICRPVIRGENVFFAVIVTKTWEKYDGMLAILDKNNKVISFPGGTAPSYKNGSLQPPESDLTTFRNPHDICIDDDENLYIPQWNSDRTYPVKLIRI